MLKLIQAVEDGIIDSFEILKEPHRNIIQIYVNKSVHHSNLSIHATELLGLKSGQMQEYLDKKMDLFLETFQHYVKEQQDAVRSSGNPELHSK